MKYLTLTSLGAILAASSLSFAGTIPEAPASPPPAVDQGGIIVGGNVGVFLLQDLSLGSSALKVDTKFKPGRGFEVPIGYDFGNGFSLFFTGGDDRVDFKSVTGNVAGHSQLAATGGNIEMIPLMANASYSLHIVGGLSWYISGGVGAVYTDAWFKDFDDEREKSITYGRLGRAKAVFAGFDNTGWDFGFQASTGLAYAISPHASVNVGYHFLHTTNNVSVNGDSSSGLNGHLIAAGLLWKF